MRASKPLKVLITAFATLLLMYSCNVSGFHQQKYTDLKPLASSELTTPLDSDLNDNGDDNDPIADLLSKGVDEDYVFIIHKNGKYYEIKKPRYDMFYYSVSGIAEEVNLEDYGDTARIEIELKPEQKITAGKGKFYVSDMESAVYKDKPDHLAKEKTPVKENIEIVTTKVEEEPDKNLKKDPVNQVGCGDTMLLLTDKRVIVQIIDLDEERIRFSYCSDSEAKLYERPTRSVKTIYYADGTVKEIGVKKTESGFEVRDPAPEVNPKYIFDHDPSHLSKGSSNCIDEMHLSSGQILKVKVLEVTETGVKYRKCEDALGRKFEKKSKFISKIKYADGFEEEIREPHMYEGAGPTERSTGVKIARGIGFTVLGIIGFIVLVTVIAIFL